MLGNRDEKPSRLSIYARDRGEGSVSYLGVTILVATIAGALVTSGLGGGISSQVAAAVCKVGGQECASPGGQTKQATAAAPNGTTSSPPPSGLSPLGHRGRQVQDDVNYLSYDSTPSPGGSSPPPGYYEQRGKALADAAEEGEARTRKTLDEIPLGRAALEWARDNGVKVEYGTGKSSYYSESGNLIYVGAESNENGDQATQFIQNVHLAKKRNSPNAAKMGREEFVNASMDNLLEANIQRIYARRQLGQTPGKEMPDGLFVRDYGTAYDNAVQMHRPPLAAGSEQAQQVGDKAGREAVKQAFQKYTAHTMHRQSYGSTWDRTDRSVRAWWCLGLWHCKDVPGRK